MDADVEQVKTRRVRDQQRIDQGLVSNPKDIQRMQQEMVSLERRITSLEDDEIEVMERLEEAQGILDRLTARARRDRREDRDGHGVPRRQARRRSTTRSARWRHSATRSWPSIPIDLLALYDRLRETKNGVGAALLRARSCSGCMLDLDNAELATIRAAADDDVIRCEECSRILVRTSESGL